MSTRPSRLDHASRRSNEQLLRLTLLASAILCASTLRPAHASQERSVPSVAFSQAEQKAANQSPTAGSAVSHAQASVISLLGELTDPEAVRASWPGTYPAGVEAHALGTSLPGLKLPAQFAKSGDRCYWDRSLGRPVDLSRMKYIQLAMGTDSELAVKERSVSLAVADPADPTKVTGWYTAFLPETPPGLQSFLLEKSDFRAEGDVGGEAGWSRIVTARISVWAGMNQSSANTVVVDLSARERPTKQFVSALASVPTPKAFAELPLVPYPQSVTRGEGQFVTRGHTLELKTGQSEAALRAGKRAAALWRDRLGVELNVVADDTLGANALVFVTAPGLEASLPAAKAGEGRVPGAYELSVSTRGVAVRADDEVGLYYGLQTLGQLVRRFEDRLELPAVEIVDSPALAVRGMYLHWLNDDEGYENARRIIAALSMMKINTVFIDVGAQMQYKSHAFPVTGAKAFTQDRMRELVAYAHEHYVDLCPYYQMYGHSKWIGDEPGYKHLMERPDNVSWYSSWNYRLPETRRFAEDILGEAIDVFQPKFVHLGHDEIEFTDIGASAQTRGIPREDLIAESINDLSSFVKSRGVKAIVWGDTFIADFPRQPASEQMDGERIARAVRKDVVVNGWLYSPDDVLQRRHLDLFERAGFQPASFLFSPWTDESNIRVTARLLQERRGLGMIGTLWHAWGGFSNYPDQISNRCLGTLGLNAYYAWNPQAPAVGYEHLDWNSRLRQLIDGGATSVIGVQRSTRPIVLPKRDINESAIEQAGLPAGRTMPREIIADGVRFDVGDRSPLVVTGSPGDGLPASESIAVGQRVSRLHFLHAVTSPFDLQRWLVPDRLQSTPTVGRYVVRYVDGSSVEVPVLYRFNAGTWNDPVGVNGARVAWSASDAEGQLQRAYWFEWINPHADREIERIELVGGQESGINVVLYAVSAE